MSFKWFDFLALAHNLEKSVADKPGHPIKQAVHRCSTSRAYYAAFCASRDFLKARGVTIYQPNKSDHALVQEKLRNFGKDGNKVASKLYDMHELRKLADYDVKHANCEADAKRVVFESENVRKLIVSLDIQFPAA